jgi:hypothetical protein
MEGCATLGALVGASDYNRDKKISKYMFSARRIHPVGAEGVRVEPQAPGTSHGAGAKYDTHSHLGPEATPGA